MFKKLPFYFKKLLNFENLLFTGGCGFVIGPQASFRTKNSGNQSLIAFLKYAYNNKKINKLNSGHKVFLRNSINYLSAKRG